MSQEEEYKTFLRISADDIYEHSKTLGKPYILTKAEAKEIFDNFDSLNVDCGLSFWDNVERMIYRYRS